MKYYHIKTYTPFVGEDADVYIAAKNENEFIQKASDSAWQNGYEWFDYDEWLEHHHDDENAEEEYYAQCHWQLIEMISKSDYDKFNFDGEWCV